MFYPGAVSFVFLSPICRLFLSLVFLYYKFLGLTKQTTLQSLAHHIGSCFNISIETIRGDLAPLTSELHVWRDGFNFIPTQPFYAVFFCVKKVSVTGVSAVEFNSI